MFTSMSFVMFSARETSAFQPNAPTFNAILNALQPLNGVFNGTRQNKSWIGRWVGPSPRVTRTLNTGSATAGFITTAAWLWEWNDANVSPAQKAAFNQQLIDAARRALLDISADWRDLAVVDYVAGVNGPLAFWTSGDASVTQTRNEFPTGLARLGVDQNPYGPTTEGTVPTPNINTLGRATDLSGLKTLAVIAGIGLGVWFLWPLITNARPSRTR